MLLKTIIFHGNKKIQWKNSKVFAAWVILASFTDNGTSIS